MGRDHPSFEPIAVEDVSGPETDPSPSDEELFTEPEWLEWFAPTPQQRWAESEKLWSHYLEIGGRLYPEPGCPLGDRRVLSLIRTHQVKSLLMGGQACVLYGAAEFSQVVPGTDHPL